MFNEAQLSLTGYVATQPVVRYTKVNQVMNVTMRVAWTPRRQDRLSGEWIDANTSYITVICWRKLATNAAVCLRKGDPVVVKGRLSVRNYVDKQGMPRTAVEAEAISIGHDLCHGIAQFSRVRPQTGMSANEFEAARAAEQVGEAGQEGVATEGQADRADDVADIAELDDLTEAGIPGPDEPSDSALSEEAIGDLAANGERAAVPF